jgi:hypothetical protein
MGLSPRALQLMTLSSAVFFYASGHELLMLLGLVMTWGVFSLSCYAASLVLLMSLSLLPLMVSPSYLGQADKVVWIYSCIQISPLYHVFRGAHHPWVGPLVYDDSPFHFVFEPLQSPMLFGCLTVMVLGVVLRARRATH